MVRPACSVDVVAMDSFEAAALRAVLEYCNIKVTIHLVGEAGDIVRVLGGEEKIANTMVLTGHGDAEGLVLPELAHEIEKEQPYHRRMSAQDFREFLNLHPDSLVINTACSLGTKEMAGAFLDAGCRYYIGATDDPVGNASLFYALHFFYEHICRKKSVEEAHEIARSHDDQTRMFHLYSRE